VEEDIFKQGCCTKQLKATSIPASIVECFTVSSELVLGEVSIDQAVRFISKIRGKVRIQRLE